MLPTVGPLPVMRRCRLQRLDTTGDSQMLCQPSAPGRSASWRRDSPHRIFYHKVGRLPIPIGQGTLPAVCGLGY